METRTQAVAGELARRHAGATRPPRRLALAPRPAVAALRRGLDEASRRIASVSRAPGGRSPGVEWFLDNEGVARAALRQVEESLSHAFCRELPAAAGADGEPAAPRALVLARAALEA